MSSDLENFPILLKSYTKVQAVMYISILTLAFSIIDMDKTIHLGLALDGFTQFVEMTAQKWDFYNLLISIGNMDMTFKILQKRLCLQR